MRVRREVVAHALRPRGVPQHLRREDALDHLEQRAGDVRVHHGDVHSLGHRGELDRDGHRGLADHQARGVARHGEQARPRARRGHVRRHRQASRAVFVARLHDVREQTRALLGDRGGCRVGVRAGEKRRGRRVVVLREDVARSGGRKARVVFFFEGVSDERARDDDGPARDGARGRAPTRATRAKGGVEVVGRRSPRSARVSLRWGGVIGPRLARSGQALGRDGTNPASTTNTARKAVVRSRTGPRVGRSFSGMSAYLRSPQRVYVISQQLHFAPAPLHASRVHRRIHALHGGRSGHRRSARDHGSSSSPPTRPRPCSPPGPAKTRGSASFGVRRAERRGAGSPNPCRGAVALWRPARVLGRGKHPDLGAPRLSARSRRRSRAFFEIRRRSVTKKKCAKKRFNALPPPCPRRRSRTAPSGPRPPSSAALPR